MQKAPVPRNSERGPTCLSAGSSPAAWPPRFAYRHQRRAGNFGSRDTTSRLPIPGSPSAIPTGPADRDRTGRCTAKRWPNIAADRSRRRSSDTRHSSARRSSAWTAGRTGSGPDRPWPRPGHTSAAARPARRNRFGRGLGQRRRLARRGCRRCGCGAGTGVAGGAGIGCIIAAVTAVPLPAPCSKAARRCRVRARRSGLAKLNRLAAPASAERAGRGRRGRVANLHVVADHAGHLMPGVDRINCMARSNWSWSRTRPCSQTVPSMYLTPIL